MTFLFGRRSDLHLVGKRVRINKMDDMDPIPSGTCGTITGIDGAGNYLVNWENGRTLSIIPEEDEFEIFENEEIKK